MLTSPLSPFEHEDSNLLLSAEQLTQYGAFWTAKEISQQPKMWRKVSEQHSDNRTIAAWLTPILAKPQLRIILTGAGTSAYIGDVLAAHIQQHLPLATQQVEAISTTDIVSHPELYLRGNIPTLLISYGRSGNSPESMAAVELAEQLVDDCYHLAITCNGQGKLANYCADKSHCYLYKLPDETHDVSFAMTSSFTCMYLATLLIFAPNSQALTQCIEMAEHILTERLADIRLQSEQPSKRVVFLGGGPLKAIAQEAALKFLELTAGQVVSAYESPLGFRHGPKSLVDSHTQVLVMVSSDPYTRQYDNDLIQELKRDNQALSVLTLSEELLTGSSGLNEVWLGLPFILWCQILAIYKAIQLKVSPDNPCPTGQVNRVVQGVNVYPFVK
ncbi:D-galactosamine-6-phosphate deaminase AgaS [Shewanella mangrovisoli]|uniref:D-galactosamine-6-phosphate deaminase AgaS n=1 Tax=Shewanella mangrovisoli TaxID=2864211 RepID=A0ABV4VEE0_9GAMM